MPTVTPLTLRAQLALWWGGLTGFVVLVVGLLFYAAESLALYNDVDRELRAAAERAVAARVPVDEGRSVLVAVTEWVGVAVSVYDHDGVVRAATPNAALAPTIDPNAFLAAAGRSEPAYDWIVRVAPPYVTVDDGEGRFGVRREPDGNRWRLYVLQGATVGSSAGTPQRTAEPSPAAYVVAVAPLRDIDAATANTRRLVPLLALVGGTTLLLAGLLLARRALRPVAALTETAATIARAGALDRRVAVGNTHDELGQLATTFNAMLDSVETAYRAQQRFVSDASHEIRTPLTAILANLDLLDRRPEIPEAERREAVGEAVRETRRLVRLVSRLLALARADAGVMPERRPVALATILAGAFEEVRRVADGRELRLEVPESPDALVVEADADQLNQVLLILLDNAVKYTPEGGVVRAGLGSAGRWAEAWVLDTGIGIPAEDLARVFERFYRGATARARDRAGSGLGLSIARWIAEQHGGEVALDSWPGGGTRAALRLPLAVSGRRAGRVVRRDVSATPHEELSRASGTRTSLG